MNKATALSHALQSANNDSLARLVFGCWSVYTNSLTFDFVCIYRDGIIITITCTMTFTAVVDGLTMRMVMDGVTMRMVRDMITTMNTPEVIHFSMSLHDLLPFSLAEDFFSRHDAALYYMHC